MITVNNVEENGTLGALLDEHRYARDFIERLRKGLAEATDIQRLRRYVGWFWIHHIRPHFFHEEKTIAAGLAETGPVKRMKNEHDVIRELIIAIDHDPLRQDLRFLADTLERHLVFEEQELFPWLLSQWSEEKRSDIEDQLNRAAVPSAVEWNDRFWELNSGS